MGSVYTISLFDLLEILNQERNTAGNLQAHIANSLPKIFDFDFPIWEESYRPTLERKIIMHYLRKEICCETPEMWKIFLNERLNLIMPYYNQLYKSTVLEYDILNDVDWTETYSNTDNMTDDYNHSRTANETTNGTGKDVVSENEIRKDTDSTNGTINNTQTTKLLGSDLPQANYNGIDYGTTLQDGNNTSDSKETLTVSKDGMTDRSNSVDRTNTGKRESTDSSNDKRTVSDTSQGTRSRKGLLGGKNRAELILDYRNAIINIDRMVINELRDLFMLIY